MKYHNRPFSFLSIFVFCRIFIAFNGRLFTRFIKNMQTKKHTINNNIVVQKEVQKTR